MSVKALSADGEVVINTDTYVSSALAFGVQVTLPEIDDGAGGTAPLDNDIRFETSGTGYIEIIDSENKRVGIVPGRSQAVVVSRAGTAQGEAQSWNFTSQPQALALLISDPTGGATVDAEARTDINSILNLLEDFGFMRAE